MDFRDYISIVSKTLKKKVFGKVDSIINLFLKVQNDLKYGNVSELNRK